MQKVEFAAAETECWSRAKSSGEIKKEGQLRRVGRQLVIAPRLAAGRLQQAFDFAAEFFGGIMRGGTPWVRPAIEDRWDQAAVRGAAVSLRFGIP